MAAVNLEFLEQLINASASNDVMQRTLADIEFNAPANVAIYTPEVCLRLSKFLKYFNNNLLKNIEISANQERIRTGEPLPKGVIEGIPDDFKQDKLSISAYFRIFCTYDPIAVNHNGHTRVVTLNAAGNPQAPQTQTIPQFIQYFFTGSQFQINDALEYIIDAEALDNTVYDKYAMPVILFTANAGDNIGNVVLGPSGSLNKFDVNGVLVTGASPYVYAGSYDYNNLTQVAISNKRKLTGGTDVKELKTKYSFPNFLLGEMLFKVHGTEEAKYVFKFYDDKNSMEFWIKLYPGTWFPYDSSKYVFPSGYNLVERADGIIMYYNTVTQTLESNFPLGSYYILPPGGDLTTVINFTNKYRVIQREVALAAAQVLPSNMSDPNIQRMLQLVAYMTNLRAIKASFIPPIIPGGGGGKKKTKRTNIIKYMAKSKKKHYK
uniref:Uncharacterized protein n=1 Tax=viral metagenome TaxID=1070528 RepID=A0A6C0I276_9ZZZZ